MSIGSFLVAVQIPLLQQRVHRNPHDSEAWQMLVDEMWNVRHGPGMLEKLKDTANVVVLRYPSAVRLKTSSTCPNCSFSENAYVA